MGSLNPGSRRALLLVPEIIGELLRRRWSTALVRSLVMVFRVMDAQRRQRFPSLALNPESLSTTHLLFKGSACPLQSGGRSFLFTVEAPIFF